MGKTLFIIPARKGSKGVPGKNKKLLNGIPLISYALRAAKELADIVDICISTDDEQIIEIAQEEGIPVPFVRPNELATDTTAMNDVLLHAYNYYLDKDIRYEKIVLLQPTSPLRTAANIAEAIEVYSSDIDMVTSVNITKSNPYYVLFEENNEGLLEKTKTGNFTRRQDCPNVWELNGAIYVINSLSLLNKGMSNFTKIKKYEMSSFNSVDIDDELDWKFAELLLQTKNE